MKSTFWRIQQVAVHFDVSVNTVRRWIAAGKPDALEAGGRRVPEDEIARFRRELKA